MAYQIKEIFYTLQGEGTHAGRPAVFCRFAGCNLWSGREEDRATAVCRFCDTDFVGVDGSLGGRYDTAQALVQQIAGLWPSTTDGDQARRFVVLTGGEPMLQVDACLIDALHGVGFEIAVETNGSLDVPTGIDWICVSPKVGAPLRQVTGHEIKVIWPQAGLDLTALEAMDFGHRYVQAMDVADPQLRLQHMQDCVALCLARPSWHLSVQTHKVIGIR